jgi:hypothetical protein
MDSQDSAAKPTKPRPSAIVITGHVLTVLVSLMLLMSATMKFLKPEGFDKQFIDTFGYQDHHAFWIGLTELACVVLYAIPRTCVLGAILLTGYLGGAVATHVRVDDPFFAPIIIGVVVWAALFLKDARIRSLIPIRW